MPNLVVDALAAAERGGGIALHVRPGGCGDRVSSRPGPGRGDRRRRARSRAFAGVPEPAARAALRAARRGRARADRDRRAPNAAICSSGLPQPPPPLLYVIVASGNIYEDRAAAVAAAEAGAQIIAVIRSTGQSLLDFVPFGATTEGFGGTYATQENFAHHARGARRGLGARSAAT